MKQCNYVVYFIDGVRVFKSARTGRVLTGAAKLACERAEERKAEAVREQKAIDEAVENALILSWYEENAIEIDAEQARCEAIAKSYADARAEAVKSEEESFEAFCDALDEAIREKKEVKQKRIAITGWALTERMIRTLESAFEDEDVKEALTHAFRKWTAEFVRNALTCMGWKYNASRGTQKGAVIDFLRRRDDERIPIFYGERYNLASTFTAMQAVTRCMRYAKEHSTQAVVIKKDVRAVLARLCRKMIQGMQVTID